LRALHIVLRRSIAVGGGLALVERKLCRLLPGLKLAAAKEGLDIGCAGGEAIVSDSEDRFALAVGEPELAMIADAGSSLLRHEER
jgi:hypothetical protein